MKSSFFGLLLNELNKRVGEPEEFLIGFVRGFIGNDILTGNQFHIIHDWINNNKRS